VKKRKKNLRMKSLRKSKKKMKIFFRNQKNNETDKSCRQDKKEMKVGWLTKTQARKISTNNNSKWTFNKTKGQATMSKK
jgi:hypothetical protein